MTNSEDDWHLKEWADHLGKRQADLVAHLGWPKGRVSKIWNSQQPYKRDLVNVLARWLEIRPHELLMPPGEALALRRLRETAALIASDISAPAQIDRSTATRSKQGHRT